MSSNETYLFPLGQKCVLVSGTDFLSGYLKGYKRAPLNQQEPLSDQNIADFLKTHSSNEPQAVSQAGYVVGAIAALVELLKGDCQIHLSQQSSKKEGNR